MIVDVKQGSDAWKAKRKQCITATDLPILIGDSIWKTPYKLWREKVGLDEEEEPNSRMLKGLELEPFVLEKVNQKLCLKMKPSVLLSDNEDSQWAMCSLDGAQFHKDGSIIYATEIKCPNAEDHETAKKGKVPQKYKAQVQWQLFVTGLWVIYYASYHEEDLVILEVKRDDSYIYQLYEKAVQFKRCVDQFIPPEMTEKEKRESNIKQIRNDEWWDLNHGYLEAKAKRDWWEKEAEELKQKLIILAGGSDAQGMGYKLSKVVTKGRVDFEAILSKNGIDVDLEQYRKPAMESWRITKDD